MGKKGRNRRSRRFREDSVAINSRMRGSQKAELSRPAARQIWIDANMGKIFNLTPNDQAFLYAFSPSERNVIADRHI